MFPFNSKLISDKWDMFNKLLKWSFSSIIFNRTLPSQFTLNHTKSKLQNNVGSTFPLNFMNLILSPDRKGYK